MKMFYYLCDVKEMYVIFYLTVRDVVWPIKLWNITFSIIKNLCALLDA